MLETLTQLNKSSLFFLRKNYKKIDDMPKIKHSNERIKLMGNGTIEEHHSGINQMLRVNKKDIVTVSDDCSLKFWSASNFKSEATIQTETITCIACTGPKKDLLVAGCHSGNLITVSVPSRTKREQIQSAHYNLIRVIVTLEALKNKYFVTADVCGILKVWTSQSKPSMVMEIQQDGAISYNSMIELSDIIPKRNQFEDSAIIACALKQ